MLLFVLGFPGGFSEWCRALTAALAAAAGGPAGLLAADTLRELAGGMIETGGAPAVVLSRRPGGALRAALLAAERKFVVALDDPPAALLDLVLGAGIALPEAVRQMAGSCAALAGCAELPGALVLRPGDRRKPAAVAAAIAHHLEIPLDERAIAALAQDFAVACPAHDVTAWWSGLGPAERELAMGALAAYLYPAATAGALTLTWAGELFFSCDHPGERAGRPVDITGRAHRLIEGPHISLPPGQWSLSLTLSCTREAAEHEFQVDILADRPLASGRLRPQREGSAAARIAFAIDAANEAPVAIRIATLRAAFDGAVTVAAARLVRAG
jgi:hypothetical protein